jgi:hypothetical protein
MPTEVLPTIAKKHSPTAIRMAMRYLTDGEPLFTEYAV